ncbi:MAG: flagellar basal body-associated FliL family protein [Steroidobacteraceae bacterium]|nr:flagellar basal body-associated FliL family protein [Steroidobacteraceae bacterium]MDW8260095.1 flagellar basal body-associated FliL family protein [Gammaproteobacteria bacterium]
MAEEPINLEGKDAAAAKQGKGKWLLIAGIALLVIAGGAAGWWYWQSQHAKAAAAQEPPVVKEPLQFLPLDPPFVVNFQDEQAVRFLQIEVRIASRDTKLIELLQRNEPVLRNDLLLLFGAQQARALATTEGKERLRAATLDQVRRIVQREGGAAEKVEGVYFTSFVMQ